MSRILYQFPISHYCEKVRWALDYKGLEFKIKNLLPGLHLRTTKKMANKSYVPILIDGHAQIQNSHEIISYLDEEYPENPLTPSDASQRAEALEWEKYCDVEIGVHIRRYCYHILLDYPQIVVPFFTQDGPWWGPLFFKFGFKRLEPVMRKVMKIDEAGAQVSQQHIQDAIDRLHGEYSQRKFLVGESFSRADLAAAALLAPLFQPEGFGLHWPDTMPPRLAGFVEKNKEKLVHYQGCYKQYR